MNQDKFLKIKIGFILQFINLLKKIGSFVFWFLEKIGQGFLTSIFLILKIVLFLFTPLYLKIKRLIKIFFFNFCDQSGIFSLFSGIKIGIPFLILVFLFIVFEQKIIPTEKWLVKAFNSPIKEEDIKTELDFSDFKMATLEDEEAVLMPNFVFEKGFVPTRTEIEKYVVQPGDTISSIAEDFEVSVNTILWENKLTPRSIIRPGQILKILPIAGVSHRVKRGETVEKIANYYKASQEDIVSFNNLEEEPLKAGDLIIIPEGKIPPPPKPVVSRRVVYHDKILPMKLEKTTRQGNNCRNFYPGQCTWYVAQRYCLPWSGHAKSWLTNARKFGYNTGKEPRVGAIISLRETWYGHVGIVEEVNEETIVISEMNHLGPWKVNKREIKKDDWRINGYIYLD